MRTYLPPFRAFAFAALATTPFVFALTASSARAAETDSSSRPLSAASSRADLDRAIESSDNYDTDALVLRSRLRAKENDPAGASVDLTRVLTLQPGRSDARVLRAEQYLALKVRSLALLDAEILLEELPGNTAFLDLKKRAEALPDLPSAVMQTLISDAVRQSAEALLKNNAVAAERAFNLATVYNLSLDPSTVDKPALFIQRGDLLVAGKRTDLARYDYGSAMSGDRRVPAAYERIARIDLAEKNYADVLQSVEAIDPGMELNDAANALVLAARAHLALATESGNNQSISAGLAALETARNYNPKLADTSELRDALIAERRKLSASTVAQFQGAQIPVALAKARDEAKAGNYDEARRISDRLQQLNPGDVTIYEARLQAVNESGLTANAAALKRIIAELRAAPPAAGSDPLSVANAAVHRRPYLSRPYIERARAHIGRAGRAASKAFALSEIKAAKEDAISAAAIDPYDPQAHVVLADAFIAEIGRTDSDEIFTLTDLRNAARNAGDAALALAPNDVALLIWRGDLTRQHDDNRGMRAALALRFYTRACRVDPFSTRAFFAHAQASSTLENYADAIADYRRILQIDPTNTYAVYELGVAQLYAAQDAAGYAEAAKTFAGLQATLALAGDRTSADAVEVQQLRAVALAAGGDGAFEPIAKDVLARSQWLGNAGAALHNLRQPAVHAKQLDQLAALKETANPALQDTRENVKAMTLDASPR